MHQLSDIVFLRVQTRPVLDRATHVPHASADSAPGRPLYPHIHQSSGRTLRVYNTADLREKNCGTEAAELTGRGG